MNEYSVSIKIGDKYETIINVKQGQYGHQLAFTPHFKNVLMGWLKDPAANYLNMNIKDWGQKVPQANTRTETPANLDDEIPF
jgi:hypothetical protein